MSEATTSSSSNTDIDYFHWSYTDAQVISLCVASTISGCLSLYGSGSIIHSIVKERRSRSRLYERFVLAVSVYDVIATTSVVLGTFMVPQHTDMLLAWGNTQTCTFSAVLFCYFVGVCWANMNLSLYFYFTVCKGWTDKHIATHFERPMHIIAFFVASTLAVAVAFTETGNPAVMGHLCSIELYPPACLSNDDIECTRGGFLALHLWMVSMLVQFVPFIISIWSTIQVTLAVTQSTRRAARAGSDAAVRRERKVMMQAVMYLLSYMNTFIWPIVLGGASLEVQIWQVHRFRPFTMAFLAHLLLPLQGFCNFFIFKKRKLSFCLCKALPTRHRGSSNTDFSGASQPFRRSKAFQNVSRFFMHPSSSSSGFLSRNPCKSDQPHVLASPTELNASMSDATSRVSQAPPEAPRSRLPGIAEETHSNMDDSSLSFNKNSSNHSMKKACRSAAQRLAGSPLRSSSVANEDDDDDNDNDDNDDNNSNCISL